ncbi:sulfatase-like hydrolase/transferase [Vibrio rhodolitus]|uniref:sulfatase-like hydrolase/transferase n=1 Tax=Vibrio rhodolitus TaxID=2231649 RepID=UPI000E0ADF8D|nr:sulfatase-like hydrolase/transferase [Vibrio rhodolitus]
MFSKYLKPIKYDRFFFLLPILFSIVVTCSEVVIRQQLDLAPLASIWSSVGYGLLVGVIVCHAKSTLIALVYSVFVIAAYSIQYSNLSYFGYWISPMDLWLLFEKFTEVYQASVSVIHYQYSTIVAVILVSLLIVAMLLSRRKNTFKSHILSFIGAGVLIFYPIKMTLDKDISLGRLPKISHTVIKTSIYTLGYFASHTFPEEVLGISGVKSVTRSAPEKLDSPNLNNIVIYMGESLSSSYMSSFGYSAQTTPWLDMQKLAGNSYFGQGFSGGLFTDVSMPFFFNMIEKPNALKQIAAGDTNLFRLAKEQGYKTYFYSSQMSSGLALVSSLGTAWIDEYADAEDITGDKDKSVDDVQLVKWLSEIDPNGKNFIVLNPSGSHEPYIERSPSDMKIFGQETLQNEYLNSVYYTDFLLEKMSNIIHESEGGWTFIVTSDHGQNVTDNTAGKGSFLYENNYLVPVYIDSNNPDVIKLARERLDSCERSFQVQLSSLVAEYLGYQHEGFGCQSGYVAGSRRTGNSGYMRLSFDEAAGAYRSEMIYN